MPSTTENKPDRLAELDQFLKDMEIRAARKGLVFDRKKLPGSKRDFQAALKKSVQSFSNLSENTIESSLGLLNCKFPIGGNICAKDRSIRKLYPEHFDPVHVTRGGINTSET